VNGLHGLRRERTGVAAGGEHCRRLFKKEEGMCVVRTSLMVRRVGELSHEIE